MNNRLQLFDNPEFGSIRVIEEGGKYLFCGSDVAKALGYAKPRNAINTHCKGALKRGSLTEGGVQELIFVPEGDVYRLIVHSRLPGAERFEKWVFDDVLPQIRMTGEYSVQERLPKDYLSALKELVIHVENEQRLLAENKELQPKGEYYDKLCDNKAYFNFRDTAKLLGIKQKELIAFLIEHKYIYKDGHKKIQPYSEYVEREDNINNGFFVKKEFTANGLSGTQTLITPKGRMKLLSILRPEVIKAEVVDNES